MHLGKITVLENKRHAYFAVPIDNITNPNAFDGFCRIGQQHVYVHWDKFNIRELRSQLGGPFEICMAQASAQIKRILKLPKPQRHVQDAA